MRGIQATAFAVTLASQAVAFQPPVFREGIRHSNSEVGKRQSHSSDDDGDESSVYLGYNPVPQYTAQLPIDHFDDSNSRTFSNRFWVNDTFYQPGGPVIVYDFGETDVSGDVVAAMLAEDRGYATAPCRLAEELNGVIVGWEHRYYGESLPVDRDDEGYPETGAEGFEYLTIEQALEDVVYFANEVFNTTELDNSDNTVLGGKKATEKLGPYHSPWIFMGGSYPGNRAAWLRVRNPEVIYAAWSSSAPVELGRDGTAYFNSIYRALPSNCTSDIQAVFDYADKVLGRGGDDATDMKASIIAALGEDYIGPYLMSSAELWSKTEAVSAMFNPLVNYVQSAGITYTTQVFCDYMETFDAEDFLQSSAHDSSRDLVRVTAYMENEGGKRPSKDGIVAANDDDGDEAGFAAYMWAYYQFTNYMNSIAGSSTASPLTTGRLMSRNNTGANAKAAASWPGATLAWEWQVMTEVGRVQAVNDSSKFSLGSKYQDLEWARESLIDQFFNESSYQKAIPDWPNSTFTDRLGGWDMKPSNTMFTNGEFDPWRAFGVSSLDQQLGAPERELTEEVPKCNKAPSGTDVFGLVFDGAVHAEDMLYLEGYEFTGTSPNVDAKDAPLPKALALFLKAYKEWAPCFNETREEHKPLADATGGHSDDPVDTNASGQKSDDDDDEGSAGRADIRSGMLWAVAGFAVFGVYIGL